MSKVDNLIHIVNRYLKNPANWRVIQSYNKIINLHALLQRSTVRVPLTLLKQSPAPAEIVLVSGIVNIKSVYNTMQAATVGSTLSMGSQVITGDNSKINLKLADGSIVTLASNSSLKLDTLSFFVAVAWLILNYGYNKSILK